MIHDNNIYLKLADQYVLLTRDSRKKGLDDAYEVVIGELWPYGYGCRKTPEYSAFITEFLNTLAEQGYKLRVPVSLYETKMVTIKIFPQKAPKSKLKGAEGVKPMLNPKDTIRPGMRGLGVIGNWVYATNGDALIKIFDNRCSAYNGKILPPDQLKSIFSGANPKLIAGRQPSYESVLTRPKGKMVRWKWDAEILVNMMYGVYRTMENTDAMVKVIPLQFSAETSPCYYSPRNLYHIVHILHTNGARTITLEYYERNRAILIRADNGNMGTIMPVDFDSERVWCITSEVIMQPKKTRRK